MPLLDFLKTKKTEIKELGYIASHVSEKQDKAKLPEDKTNPTQIKGKEIGAPHPIDFSLLENAYITVPIINGSINKTVNFITGEELKIEAEDQKLKDRIKKEFRVFNRIHGGLPIIYSCVRNALVYGCGFAELAWTGNKVNRMKLLDSKSMYIRRDKKGNIIGFTQYYENEEPVYFKPEEILFIVNDPIGTDPYGVSMIRPLIGDGNLSVFKQSLVMLNVMGDLLKREIAGKMHFKVGNDMNQPNQTIIDRVAQDVEKAKNNTEFITSYLVDMDVKGFYGKTLDMTPFIKYFEDNYIYALQVPSAILGKSGLGSVGNVELNAFENRIKSLQMSISKELEVKLFDKVFDTNDYELVWSKREDKELEELNILIRFLADKFVLSPETRLVIENRVRTLLGNSPIDRNSYDKDMSSDLSKKLELVKSGMKNNLSNQNESSKSDVK